MTQGINNSKHAGLYAAMSAIEIFKAKYLLANPLAELLDTAEVLADFVDPDDEAGTEMAETLLRKLTELQLSESELRVVSDAGFALDAQVPLALAAYQAQCRENGRNLLGGVA